MLAKKTKKSKKAVKHPIVPMMKIDWVWDPIDVSYDDYYDESRSVYRGYLTNTGIRAAYACELEHLSCWVEADFKCDMHEMEYNNISIDKIGETLASYLKDLANDRIPK